MTPVPLANPALWMLRPGVAAMPVIMPKEPLRAGLNPATTLSAVASPGVHKHLDSIPFTPMQNPIAALSSGTTQSRQNPTPPWSLKTFR
jgi:hypothetical protein